MQPSAETGTGAASGGATDGDLPTIGALERKIIYTATVDLIVDDFSPIPGKVDELVNRYGGFIANSKVSGATGDNRSGQWKLRIPVARFDDFLRDVQKGLGEVRSVGRDSQDVSEEFYDFEARIRNKRQEETRLLKLLEDRTGSLEDVLGIERELTRVREEIERLEGRMRVLTDLTSLTTVTLSVQEAQHYVPEEATTFSTRVQRSLYDSLWNMRSAGEACVVGLAGAAPWLALLAAPLALVVRAWRRHRRGQATSLL